VTEDRLSHLRADREIRAVLTPKQQQRFDELVALHRERFLYGAPGTKAGARMPLVTLSALCFDAS